MEKGILNGPYNILQRTRRKMDDILNRKRLNDWERKDLEGTGDKRAKKTDKQIDK